ncbi:hypothetical protein KAI87_17410, partial [Myxococcota bacterium]|nr:hypothetical protein [Myxococcota bacterium]
MVRFTSFVLAGIVALGVSVSVSAAESYKLGDAVFAKKLCAGWNSSSLPKALGSEEQGGSGWIDVETTGNAPKGMQKIVSGRADCEGWTKFELLIEKQEDGSAKCTSS